MPTESVSPIGLSFFVDFPFRNGEKEKRERKEAKLKINDFGNGGNEQHGAFLDSSAPLEEIPRNSITTLKKKKIKRGS